jgi:hypothetical protein
LAVTLRLRAANGEPHVLGTLTMEALRPADEQTATALAKVLEESH